MRECGEEEQKRGTLVVEKIDVHLVHTQYLSVTIKGTNEMTWSCHNGITCIVHAISVLRMKAGWGIHSSSLFEKIEPEI